MIFKLFLLIVFLSTLLAVVYKNNKTYFMIVMGNESKAPEYNKGDIVIIANYPNETIQENDLVVFIIENYYVMHRIIDVYNCKNMCNPVYISQGGHTRGNDSIVYHPGVIMLQRKDIIGRPWLKIPCINSIKFWFKPKFN
jgi:signal peptidase I